jgi:hypothetical protein
LVTRPSLPVPATEPAARLLSAISLAAAGMATPALLPPGGSGRGGRQQRRPRGCAAGAAAPRLAFGVDAGDQLLGHHGGAVGLHDFGQHAGGGRGHFQHDLVGLDLDQDFIDGDGVAGLLLPLQQVASATDSDSCGTLTSTIAMISVFLSCVFRVWALAPLCGEARQRQRWGLFGEDKALELAEGAIHQRLLLLLVQVRIAHGGRGRRGRPA